MIYFTGDIHGDPSRFNSKNFPEQKEMTKDDYVIIAGDFGLIWSNSKEENHWLDWLNEKPFTTLFIDGNHENFDLLYSFPEVDFCGGKAHKIRDSIYHLERGYIFEIDGKSIFAFGGASSHDIQDGILDPNDYDDIEDFHKVYKNWYRQQKMFRVKGYSWWEQELPTDEEMNRGIENLAARNGQVDIVLTHCCAGQVISMLGYHDVDKLTKYFNELLDDGLDFKVWVFGHYHDNKQILSNYLLLYEKIVRIS